MRTLVGFVLCIVVGLIAWKMATRKTPAQLEALYNLSIVNEIEQVWQAHKERPRGAGASILDPRQFDPLRSDLEKIDLYDVDDQVTALHSRFLNFIDQAPGHFEQLAAGAPDQGHVPGTRLSRQNEEWLLKIRNAGIQLEVKLRKLKEEIARLQSEFSARAAAGA